MDDEEYDAESPVAALDDGHDDDDISDTEYADLIDGKPKTTENAIASQEKKSRESSAPSAKQFTVREQSEMFQLRSFLGQIDKDYSENQQTLQRRRDELDCCRDRQRFLERERSRIGKALEENKDNVAAVGRLQAEMTRVLKELTTETELEAQIRTQLRQAEYDLAIAEVQHGRMQLVDAELRQLEGKLTVVQSTEAEARIKRENEMQFLSEAAKLSKKKQLERSAKRAEEEAKRRQESAHAAFQRAALAKEALDDKVARDRDREAQVRRQEFQRHTNAILQLKDDIKKNREGLVASQARRKANGATAEAEEKILREEFRRQGLHPDQQLLVRKRLKALEDAKAEIAVKSRAREIEIASKLLQEEESMQRRQERQPYLFRPLREHFVQNEVKLKPLQLVNQMITSLDLQSARPVFETQHTFMSSRGLRHRSLSAHKQIDGESWLAPEMDSAHPRAASAESDQKVFVRKPDEKKQRTDEDDEELAVPEFEGLWLADDSVQKAKNSDMTGKQVGKTDIKGLSKRSKLEEEMLQRSMERLRAGAIHRQIAAGREFKGESAFYSTPKTIVFKDIDVGVTYKRRVVLTNVTYSLNSCKFVDLTETLKNFVQIDFNPPGHISAGMTCEFGVTFTPQLNCDLEGEVRFLASTGPFSVPFKALTKKCIISCSETTTEYASNEVKAAAGEMMAVDFGTMVIYGISRRFITFSNAGALPTNFTIEGYNSKLTLNENDAENENKDQSQADDEFYIVPSDVIKTEDGHVFTGTIPSFGSVKCEIAWEPKVPMSKCTSNFVASFTHPDNPPITVIVRGSASDVPVHFERTTVDLRICTYNRLFQDSINLNNRAKTALRLTFTIPPALRNHLDVLPHTGYIQAESSFSAQVKFFPKLTLPKDLECTGTKYFDPITGVLEVPLTVIVADQTRTIECYITAVVTNSDVEFDLQQIDFGCCTIYEAVRVPLTMRNKSLLPQEFAFLNMPDYAEVQPADGFGTLLPLEELPLEVVFLPTKAGDYRFDLCCKTMAGREFKIPCTGIAAHPPLKLSEQIIHFRPTGIDDYSVAKLFVVNEHVSANEFSHAVPRIGAGEVSPVGPTSFHFVVPQNVPITISPCVGTVKPGQKETVRVRFAPTIADSEVRERASVIATAQIHASQQSQQTNDHDEQGPKKPGATGQKTGAPVHHGKDKKAVAIKQITPDQIDPTSPVYFQAKTNLLLSTQPDIKTYVIPCYVAFGEATATQPLPFEEENTLYLVVHCPSVRPHMLLLSDYGSYVKDFGEIAVGQIERSHVSIQNISNETLDMRSSALDPTGPFELRNALQSMEPGNIITAIFAFEPKEERLYQENIRIDCGLSCLTMTMRGRGVKPALEFNGLGADRILDLGCVLAGEYTERSFTIENKSSVAVEYRIEMDAHATPTGQPVANLSGRTVFDIVPQNGILHAGEKRQLTVNFAPDRSGSFAEKACFFLFQKPASAYSFKVVGRSSRRMVYAYGGDQLEPETVSLASLATATMLSEQEQSDGGASGENPTAAQTSVAAAAAAAVAGGQHPPLLLLLPLSASEQVVERSIHIGCARSILLAAKKFAQEARRRKNARSMTDFEEIPITLSAEFIIDNLNNLKQYGITVEPSKGVVDMGNETPITVSWRPSADQKISTSVNIQMIIATKADVSMKIPVSIRAFVTASPSSKS